MSGHRPWCTDHNNGSGQPGDQWCEHIIKGLPDGMEILIVQGISAGQVDHITTYDVPDSFITADAALQIGLAFIAAAVGLDPDVTAGSVATGPQGPS